MPSLLSFASLLLSKSNLQAERLDFHQWRMESLKGLEQFLPRPLQSPRVSAWLPRNKTAVNLLSAAAHIKSSYGTRYGHLSVPEQKLFYVRIPKAASTSIAFELLTKIKPALKTESLNPTQINFLADAWLNTTLSHDAHHFTGFTIVRHPVSRLFSVYRDFFQRDAGKPFIYQNYLGGILPQTLSFDEFVERISRIPNRFKDQHFKPQHLFIKPYRKKGISIQVFKLEEPEKLQQFLLPYNIALPHLNKSPETTPIPYRESTLDTIKKMYAFDFKVYEYDHNLGW
ncbi:MAG: sulfotransferase family 2 domain-containing protein [Cyclobacteriaceae bacterium]|nr:sulfotransferase family 2 domain-containing protein [Cyclobacteriaceae bacterium]